jgi:hypothetical protein
MAEPNFVDVARWQGVQDRMDTIIHLHVKGMTFEAICKTCDK